MNIVREAERLGRGVRAVGTSWSNSDVAVSPGVRRRDRPARQRPHRVSPRACLDAPAASGRDSSTSRPASSCSSSTPSWTQEPRAADDGRLERPVAGRGAVDERPRHGRRPRPDPRHGPRDPPRRPGRRPALDRTERRRSPTTTRSAARARHRPANIHYDDDWFNSVLVSVGSMGIIYSLIVEVDHQYDLISTAASARLGARSKTG